MAGDAYEELREAILVGDLAPGSSLRLEELAGLLGMSISPVREAIRLLEAQGLAEYAPYRGARVTDLSETEMAEIYEARIILECAAVRRAAGQFTEEHGERLEATLVALENAYEVGDPLVIIRQNSAFHSSIAEASGSSWLQRLLRMLLETSERYAAAVLRDGQASETRAIEAAGHRAILTALRTGDPDASERAVIDHLNVFEGLFASRFSAGLED